MHRYETRRLLGCGSGGEALLAEGPGGPAVLKCIQLAGTEEWQQRRALREVRILRRLRHPNVLRARDAFVNGPCLVVVSEYCDAGDLGVLIARRRARAASASAAAGCHDAAGAPPGFSEGAVLGVFAQVARAVHYIHGEGVVHRDLKASNVFLTRTGTVRVGDFGVATEPGLNITAAGCARLVGTIHHLPPEVCDGGAHTKAGDCWALGVTLHHMCALCLPFQGTNPLSIALQVMAASPEPLSEDYSPALRSLCSSLLCPDVRLRATAGEALQSPALPWAREEASVAEDFEAGQPLGAGAAEPPGIVPARTSVPPVMGLARA